MALLLYQLGAVDLRCMMLGLLAVSNLHILPVETGSGLDQMSRSMPSLMLIVMKSELVMGGGLSPPLIYEVGSRVPLGRESLKFCSRQQISTEYGGSGQHNTGLKEINCLPELS